MRCLPLLQDVLLHLCYALCLCFFEVFVVLTVAGQVLFASHEHVLGRVQLRNHTSTNPAAKPGVDFEGRSFNGQVLSSEDLLLDDILLLLLEVD